MKKNKIFKKITIIIALLLLTMLTFGIFIFSLINTNILESSHLTRANNAITKIDNKDILKTNRLSPKHTRISTTTINTPNSHATFSKDFFKNQFSSLSSDPNNAKLEVFKKSTNIYSKITSLKSHNVLSDPAFSTTITTLLSTHILGNPLDLAKEIDGTDYESIISKMNERNPSATANDFIKFNFPEKYLNLNDVVNTQTPQLTSSTSQNNFVNALNQITSFNDEFDYNFLDVQLDATTEGMYAFFLYPDSTQLDEQHKYEFVIDNRNSKLTNDTNITSSINKKHIFARKISSEYDKSQSITPVDLMAVFHNDLVLQFEQIDNNGKVEKHLKGYIMTHNSDTDAEKMVINKIALSSEFKEIPNVKFGFIDYDTLSLTSSASVSNTNLSVNKIIPTQNVDKATQIIMNFEKNKWIQNSVSDRHKMDFFIGKDQGIQISLKSSSGSTVKDNISIKYDVKSNSVIFNPDEKGATDLEIGVKQGSFNKQMQNTGSIDIKYALTTDKEFAKISIDYDYSIFKVFIPNDEFYLQLNNLEDLVFFYMNAPMGAETAIPIAFQEKIDPLSQATDAISKIYKGWSLSRPGVSVPEDQTCIGKNTNLQPTDNLGDICLYPRANDKDKLTFSYIPSSYDDSIPKYSFGDPDKVIKGEYIDTTETAGKRIYDLVNLEYKKITDVIGNASFINLKKYIAAQVQAKNKDVRNFEVNAYEYSTSVNGKNISPEDWFESHILSRFTNTSIIDPWKNASLVEVYKNIQDIAKKYGDKSNGSKITNINFFKELEEELVKIVEVSIMKDIQDLKDLAFIQATSAIHDFLVANNLGTPKTTTPNFISEISYKSKKALKYGDSNPLISSSTNDNYGIQELKTIVKYILKNDLSDIFFIESAKNIENNFNKYTTTTSAQTLDDAPIFDPNNFVIAGDYTTKALIANKIFSIFHYFSTLANVKINTFFTSVLDGSEKQENQINILKETMDSLIENLFSTQKDIEMNLFKNKYKSSRLKLQIATQNIYIALDTIDLSDKSEEYVSSVKRHMKALDILSLKSVGKFAMATIIQNPANLNLDSYIERLTNSDIEKAMNEIQNIDFANEKLFEIPTLNDNFIAALNSSKYVLMVIAGLSALSLSVFTTLVFIRYAKNKNNAIVNKPLTKKVLYSLLSLSLLSILLLLGIAILMVI